MHDFPRLYTSEVPERGNPEAVLVNLGWHRRGALTRRELLAAGVSDRVIARLLARRMLVPVHPGVYLVGPGPTLPLAQEAAALLACQPRALLTHTTAARLWGLPSAADSEIHVTVAGRWRRSLAGVRVHSITHVLPGEVRHRHNLPVSSPSLTLLDLAGTPGYSKLAEALNEARVQRLVSERELRITLEGHPVRPGAARLRALLRSESEPRITRSQAERRALGVMREHGIEPDGSDVSIGPYRVDFWFEAERLAVEVDGFRYHGTAKRFVDDRRRTAYLAGRGIQVFPLTWEDTGTNAARAMASLKRALAVRSA